MASKEGRIVHPWSTPPKRLMKCILVALHDEGLRGAKLYEAFAGMVPAWRKMFDQPISDAAPVQRADKARRGGQYAGEAPEAHPVMSKMFPHAVKAVAKRQRFTNGELREMAEKLAEKKPGKVRSKEVSAHV
jgi:hypothetical protein